jgi:hypothetical protein
VLKVSDDCKKAIDSYFDSLDQIDKMNVPAGTKVQMQTRVTSNVVKEPGWRDKMAELVINSYVSSLGTPAVNLLSALVKAPLIISERAILGLVPGNKVKFAETYGMVKGFFEGIAEGVSFAKQGWTEGMPLDTRVNVDQMTGFGKGSTSGPIERGLAPIVTAPTKAGVFVDEWSKAVFRRMQLNALAYRISRGVPEDKLAGQTRDELYTKLRSVDIGDPTKAGNTRAWQAEVSKISPDIADELVNFAKIQTFQADLGKVGNFLLKARAEHPELVLIAPFIKTPINILKDALSYTGAGFFMNQFKGKRDEAAARLLIGSGIAAMTAQQVLSGNLTGSYPKDANRRESMIAQNIPEYSVKIGDRWYSYARIEPLASVLGVVSDGVESIVDYARQPKADQKIEKLAADGVLAITKNLASKTFLEGISGMLQAIHDPDRYGGSFVNGFATVLVPGALAQFARGTDPVQRDVQSFTDALQNRVPGLRTDLPVRYDILGQERVNPAYGVMGSLGIASREATQSPLQRQLSEVNFAYTAPERKIRGVELSETDYENYSKRSGELVNQYLESVITSPSYNNYSKAQKKMVLEKTAERARSAARNQMLSEKLRTDKEFYDEFVRQRLKSRGVVQE